MNTTRDFDASKLEAPGRRDFGLFQHAVEIGPELLDVPVCILWPGGSEPTGKCGYTNTQEY